VEEGDRALVRPGLAVDAGGDQRAAGLGDPGHELREREPGCAETENAD
jgi:hypothetical protein